MAVINNAAPAQAPAQSDSGMGFLLGIILLIVAVVAFLYYGLPAIQRSTSAPSVNVPGKIDVNVNK